MADAAIAYVIIMGLRPSHTEPAIPAGQSQKCAGVSWGSLTGQQFDRRHPRLSISYLSRSSAWLTTRDGVKTLHRKRGTAVLKRIGGAIAVVCVSLGGCMGLQPTAYSSLSATEAAAESEMWESEATPSFRSGAPRRTSQPRLAKSAPSEEQTRATSVKVASAARSVSDATPSPDVVPGDRSVLLLPSNREKFLKEGLTEADRKGAHIVRSICSGC